MLRRAGWWSILGLVVLGGAAMTLFLWPSPAKALPDMVIGGQRLDYRTGARAAAAVQLVRQDDHWSGAVSDFAPGSIVHFRPQGWPGFFVGRTGDGTLHAFADRNDYNGRRLKWALLPTSRYTVRTWDGEIVVGAVCERVTGPCAADCYDVAGLMMGMSITGPLAQFPLTTEGSRVMISTVPASPRW